MAQNNLFMVKIVREKQNTTGSLGLKYFGQGDDGHEYALKTLAEGPLLPATEWVCYCMCRAVGIPTPDFLAVERLDGSVAFGSRLETVEQLKSQSPTEIVKLFSKSIVEQSQIYGFDAFLGNQDRHLGNFLFRPRQSGFLPLAFDFDQAWINLQQPFGAIPWPVNSRSKMSLNYLKSLGYFDDPAAVQVGRALVDLPDNAMSLALGQCHGSWTAQLNFVATLNVWNQRKAHWIEAQSSLN